MCIAENVRRPGSTATLLSVDASPQLTRTLCVSFTSGSVNEPVSVAWSPSTTLVTLSRSALGGVFVALTVSLTCFVPVKVSSSRAVPVTKYVPGIVNVCAANE